MFPFHCLNGHAWTSASANPQNCPTCGLNTAQDKRKEASTTPSSVSPAADDLSTKRARTSPDDTPPPSSSAPARASQLEGRGALLAHPPGGTVLPCGLVASSPSVDVAPSRLAPPPAVINATPGLTVGSGILLDKRNLASFPRIPEPTPTVLTLGVVVTGGDYGGDATLSISGGAGSVHVFTSAACNDLAPKTLDSSHPLVIANLTLKAGLTYYLRGRTAGKMTFRLTLAPQPGVTVHGPASADSEVVNVTLAARFRGSATALPDALRFDLGHLLPIPRAPLVAPRARLDVSSSVGAAAHLVLNAGTAARLSLFVNEDPADVTPGAFATAVQGDHTRWVAGHAANAPLWVDAGLRLADGTVLRHGDCVLYQPLDQREVSLGFEWEVTGLFVQARHEEPSDDITEPLMAERKWMDLPSKSTAYKSPNALGRMSVAVEMATPTYGEFVIGPSYSYAELEAQLSEVKRVRDFIHHHKIVVSKTHPTILSTNDGEFNDEWAPANSKVTFENRYRQWGGTAQATFAVPLWMLPTVLGELDDAAGVAARDLALATPLHEQVRGLVAAVDYYIRRLGPGLPRVAASDGPKTCCTVMFRTDFCAMYGGLDGAGQAAFRGWALTRADRAGYMLPNGVSTPALVRGPTIGTWLDSISAPGVDGKDAMSPPPGFPRHATPATQQIPYGMGLLGRDATTGHIIAEYRDFGNVASLKAFLDRVFDFATARGLSGARTWTKPDDTWAAPGAAAPNLGAATEYKVLA